MMNFSLAIPTWVNVKRIKGKPAYHPFSTHISAFSVHDDDFSGKMPSPPLPLSRPSFLPLACARIQMSKQPLVPAVGTMGGCVRYAAKAPGLPHRERSRAHAPARATQARRDSSPLWRPCSRAYVPACTISPARTMFLPQVTRSPVARDSPSNLAFAISLVPTSAETSYHEIRTRTQEGGAHGSRRKALSRIAFPIVSHHR